MPHKQITIGVITQKKGAHLAEYFRSLVQTPEVSGVAVADESGESQAEARETLKNKFIGPFDDAAKMLRQVKPQLALVSMETKLAPASIDQALEAGCHVLTEKPACLRAEDFAALVRKAEAKHLEIMLALANRPHSPVQKAREIVRTDLLGQLYGVSMHLVADQARLHRPDYQNSWRCSKARAGGGHLIWLGIHWLDLAMYISGLDVQQVAGFTNVIGGAPIDVEDSAAVSMKFEKGVLGTMLSGFYLDKTFKENVQRYHSHMKIWGADGWLKLSTFEDQPLLWYSRKAKGEPRVQTFNYPRDERSYHPFVREACRAAAGLQDPPITSQESLRVLEVIYAAYKAAESGKVQKV